MQDQIDQINDRIDNNESDQQEFSDSVDQQFSDTQSALDEHAQSLDSLNETAGQLQYPLTQDTIDLINELFPRGTVTLSGGTYTLLDGRISPNTVVLTSLLAIGGLSTRVPYYYVTPTAGQAVFTSSVNTDTSTLGYLLLIS